MSRGDIPIQSTTVWSVHSSIGINCSSKGGETDTYTSHTQGYTPVPRQLVSKSHVPPSLSPAYTNTGQDLSRPRLSSKCREIGTGTQSNLRLCRLPVRPPVRPGQAHTKRLAKPSRENTKASCSTELPGPTVHVLDRFTNSHGETSAPRSAAYEAHTVAPQKQLESTRITRKRSFQDPGTCTLTYNGGGKQCAPRSAITPIKTCSADPHRHIKRRVGCSLKRTHCKRVLVSARKQVAHKLSGTKNSFSSFKRVPRPLCGQHSPSGHRQYDSSVI